MDISLIGLLGLGVLLAIVALVMVVKVTRRRGPTQDVPICPACLRPVEIGANSCPHCGHSLGGRPNADGPRLVAVEGCLAGCEFAIPPPPKGLSIGRAPSNDVAVPDDVMVSRHHAQIMLEDSQYVLHDRNSVNGVFVNNQRVVRHVLTDGDVIQICNSSFRFAASAAQASPVSQAAPPEEKSPPDKAPMDSMRLPALTYFEGYLLEKELGRGGMSVVYKARDARGMPVAIKVLDVTDEYLVRKFVQEGEIGAALRDHRNIRTVYRQKRSQDDRLYLVMEYIEGMSLREFINRTATPAEIVRLIGQVCDALHYAHQRHIVHRDIKPENILIDNNGTVKVTDFGIAKLTSSVTVTSDRIVGTPEYLSPEQAQGQQRILPPSDIYSLGVVLYEMLAGRPPFTIPCDLSPREATMSVLSAHIETKPTPPSRIQHGVSERLERVALKALNKEPKRRFSTAWEMSQALGFQREAAPPPPSPKVVHLVIVRGSHVGRRITLGSELTVLGREQIAPEDRQLSRSHLSVEPRGDQLWLEDMSLNGTWVNGERVFGEIPLEAGDEISVSNHILRVEI